MCMPYSHIKKTCVLKVPWVNIWPLYGRQKISNVQEEPLFILQDIQILLLRQETHINMLTYYIKVQHPCISCFLYVQVQVYIHCLLFFVVNLWADNFYLQSFNVFNTIEENLSKKKKETQIKKTCHIQVPSVDTGHAMNINNLI